MPTRSGHELSARPRAAISPRISRDASTACRAAPGSSRGAPNTAMNPSPRNLLMKPPRRSTASIMKAKRALRNSTTSAGSPRAGLGGEVADVQEHHADLAHLAGELGRLPEQAVDHRGRDVLAEQVGDPLARRHLVHRVAERGAETPTHKSRDEAGHQHDR